MLIKRGAASKVFSTAFTRLLSADLTTLIDAPQTDPPGRHATRFEPPTL